MIEQVLADTSVWIDFFDGIENEQVNLLIEYLEEDYPVFICPPIIQEVLHGIKYEKDHKLVKDYLCVYLNQFFVHNTHHQLYF